MTIIGYPHPFAFGATVRAALRSAITVPDDVELSPSLAGMDGEPHFGNALAAGRNGAVPSDAWACERCSLVASTVRMIAELTQDLMTETEHFPSDPRALGALLNELRAAIRTAAVAYG